ncbi:MAG: family 78 glycoside hydrolase catalytic domain [Eubacteriales bacterium]|nr:family 78 glycoside hydrolase catalytic domain [Eubacteriales bacterium]
MNIGHIRVEHRKHPVGLDVKTPRFSWVIVSEEGNCMQSAYRITVQKVEEGIGAAVPVWDSGKVSSDQSILVAYGGETLCPETGYAVKIQVWDNQGREAFGETFFETGLLCPEEMEARWIAAGEQETEAPSVFFRTVHVERKVAKARIYATAHGIYELSIDGGKVGDAFFAPGWTSYHHRLQYQTYDVTDLLCGVHRIELTVADGWYKGPYGFTLRKNIYGDRKAVLAELHITYENGTKQIIGTDENWKVTTGSIRESQIYLGETIDSNFAGEAPKGVEILSERKDNLIAQEGECVRITERTEAKELIETPKGELVLDFGQNMSGVVEVRIKGTRGQKIVIHHAETLDREGNFYPETLRQAVSVDTYFCDGTEQVFMPHFTFHGFRYIQVEGLAKEEIVLSDFVACAIHSDMEQTGSFACSDTMVNQLQSNIQWGMRSNFLDIPTDCPQRDERLGWTGDAQIFAATASYNRNTALFFEKWLRDLAAEQTQEWGVPHVVPNILGDQAGAAAWSDAAAIIPWVVYETYGDRRVLEEQYGSMKGWVDYITAHCEDNGLWQSGFQYGDWLALDKEESADRAGATDKYLVANAYYAYSCGIVKKAAEVLGKQEDAARYSALYQKIKAAFNEEYITRTGRLVSETQTGCVLALYFDLADPQYRERILQSLVTNIENHKNHLSTGFVGTPYLCHTLSENGCHDLAGTIFLQEDYPSWLYAVKKGATTVWERWNSIMPDGTFEESGMNSLNHYAYGSIGEWMYRKLAGIQLIEAGYKRFAIRPMFIRGITWVDAELESPYGKIRSSWKCEDGKITVEVTVPANTTAEIYLPEKEGKMLLGSGSYRFEYGTKTRLERARFTMESTLQQIIAEPLAVQMFDEMSPGMLDGPMIRFAYQMTMAELTAMAPEAKPMYEVVIAALNGQER